MKNNTAEIYIHIPFCVKKCDYCDFLSFKSDEDTKNQYVNALLKEITASSQLLKSRRISSVFFGGGTPTVLTAEQLIKILHRVFACYEVEKEAEITFECNPGTADFDKLKSLKEAGFNRISIGAQSFNDQMLKAIGRIHDRKAILECVENAKKAGFDRINVDLISALPDQTLDMWLEDLKTAAELGIEHISAYSLILEEETPLYNRASALNFPDEDTERKMYEETLSTLENFGLYRYEISNYSKPGCECRHNLGYWSGIPYIGLGLGASSYLNNKRYKNTSDINEYLECSASPEKQYKEIETLSKEDLMSEYIILGLRKTKGISIAGFKEEFGEELETTFKNTVDKYLKSGHLIKDGDYLRFSEDGLSVSNVILSDFI